MNVKPTLPEAQDTLEQVRELSLEELALVSGGAEEPPADDQSPSPKHCW